VFAAVPDSQMLARYVDAWRRFSFVTGTVLRCVFRYVDNHYVRELNVDAAVVKDKGGNTDGLSKHSTQVLALVAWKRVLLDPFLHARLSRLLFFHFDRDMRGEPPSLATRALLVGTINSYMHLDSFSVVAPELCVFQRDLEPD